MEYKKHILNLLLDKYEDSKHFEGNSKINRNVSLKFGSREYTPYNIEDIESKNAIHSVMHELELKRIISIQWVRFERENIIEKINLNLENIRSAYSEIHRTPKIDALISVKNEISQLLSQVETPWIKEFFNYILDEINNKNRLCQYVPKDKETYNLLLAALKGVETKGNDDMLERIFSKKYLGNSKAFEKHVRSRFITILRKFYTKDDVLEEQEILESVGIVKNSEELLFKGPLVITLLGADIDYAPFVYGASMNTDTIKAFEVKALPIDKIVTIENKANYIKYKNEMYSPGELVVFLGGFYSPVKQIFLKKLYLYHKHAKKEVKFYHWGDIDIGGFRIFNQLRKNIITELEPMHMDRNTLVKYDCEGENLNADYRKKLQCLQKNQDYQSFYDVIGDMLKYNIKLEQEALL